MLRYFQIKILKIWGCGRLSGRSRNCSEAGNRLIIKSSVYSWHNLFFLLLAEHSLEIIPLEGLRKLWGQHLQKFDSLHWIFSHLELLGSAPQLPFCGVCRWFCYVMCTAGLNPVFGNISKRKWLVLQSCSCFCFGVFFFLCLTYPNQVGFFFSQFGSCHCILCEQICQLQRRLLYLVIVNYVQLFYNILRNHLSWESGRAGCVPGTKIKD